MCSKYSFVSHTNWIGLHLNEFKYISWIKDGFEWKSLCVWEYKEETHQCHYICILHSHQYGFRANKESKEKNVIICSQSDAVIESFYKLMPLCSKFTTDSVINLRIMKCFAFCVWGCDKYARRLFIVRLLHGWRELFLWRFRLKFTRC